MNHHSIWVHTFYIFLKRWKCSSCLINMVIILLTLARSELLNRENLSGGKLCPICCMLQVPLYKKVSLQPTLWQALPHIIQYIQLWSNAIHLSYNLSPDLISLMTIIIWCDAVMVSSWLHRLSNSSLQLILSIIQIWSSLIKFCSIPILCS